MFTLEQHTNELANMQFLQEIELGMPELRVLLMFPPRPPQAEPKSRAARALDRITAELRWRRHGISDARWETAMRFGRKILVVAFVFVLAMLCGVERDHSRMIQIEAEVTSQELTSMLTHTASRMRLEVDGSAEVIVADGVTYRVYEDQMAASLSLWRLGIDNPEALKEATQDANVIRSE